MYVFLALFQKILRTMISFEFDSGGGSNCRGRNLGTLVK